LSRAEGLDAHALAAEYRCGRDSAT